MISSLSEKSEMGVNGQLLQQTLGVIMNGRQSHRSNIQQGGNGAGIWRPKKKEGKYKSTWLVNIIMCASCNHPFKCRYRRGVLTDGSPRGQRRHEDLELDGNRSKVTTPLLKRVLGVVTVVFVFLLLLDMTKSEQHQCSGNVTD